MRAFRAIRSTAVLLASVVAMLALATIVWSDAPANADSHPDGVTVTEVLRSPGLVVLRLTHTAGTSADFTLVRWKPDGGEWYDDCWERYKEDTPNEGWLADDAQQKLSDLLDACHSVSVGATTTNSVVAGGGTNYTATVGSSSKPISIAGVRLIHGEKYQFELRNADLDDSGVVRWSDKAEAEGTPSGNAPSPVSGLTATADPDGDNEVDLEWTLPTTSNPAVTHIQIRHRVKGSDDPGAWTNHATSASAPKTMHTVEGLRSETTYTFEVRTYTERNEDDKDNVIREAVSTTATADATTPLPRVPEFAEDAMIESISLKLLEEYTSPQPLPEAKARDDANIAYSINPELPEGLSFDKETRMISGTARKSQAARTYDYIAEATYPLPAPSQIAKLTFNIAIAFPPDTAYITKIEPVFRSVAVSPGETVVLRTLLYGLQGEVDGDLDTDEVSFSWSYAAAGSNDTNAISGNDAAVPFTVPSSPGTYTAKATLTNDYCASSTPNDWKASDCTAEFEVVVKRPSASAAEQAPPVNPPANAIPSILTDSDGNQYEVFTPEQGGTFAGEGYWVQAHPGAVPNGEVIGIRMAVGDDADNSDMTAHRYTLGGSTYEIAAVDADGASVSGYVLEPNGLEVCVPLPDHLRANVSDANVVAHANDSLAILTSTVRINADGLLVCGTLSHLPATVAAGIEGSPKAAEVADDPTAPATGGVAPASGTPLLLLAIGVLVGVIGVATLLTARRRRSMVGATFS